MPHTETPVSRRAMLAQSGRLLMAAAVLPHDWPRWAKPFPHPDPRPGITGASVLKAEELGTKRNAVLEAYDTARTFPQLFDGLYCVCECDENMKHRSLLACFESRQPVGCHSCVEQAALVERLAKQDKTLAEIRQAFDKKWG